MAGGTRSKCCNHTGQCTYHIDFRVENHYNVCTEIAAGEIPQFKLRHEVE